jgi:acylglycerol lipase
VWGWSNLPLAYRTTLWLGAHGLGRQPVTAPRAVTRRITASDNVAMLRALGQDPLMIFETRIDVLYGLVRLMERAYKAADRLPPPTLLLYGQKDQIVPPHAIKRTAARLPAHVRTLSYPTGYHMLLRDLQAQTVWADIAAFITDPNAASPSGVGPISASSRR